LYNEILLEIFKGLLVQTSIMSYYSFSVSAKWRFLLLNYRPKRQRHFLIEQVDVHGKR